MLAEGASITAARRRAASGDVVLRPDALLRGFGEAARRTRSTIKLRTAAAKAGASPGGTRSPVIAGHDDLADAAAVSGDDRQAARLRLEQGHAERLVERRPDEKIGGGEPAGDRCRT